MTRQVAGVLVAEFAAATVLIAGGAAVEPDHSASVPVPVVVDGRTVGLVSLGGVRTDALLHRVRSDIGVAISAVDGFWGTDWGHGDTLDITIVATDSDEQFMVDAHLDQRRQWTDIAAVSALVRAGRFSALIGEF